MGWGEDEMVGSGDQLEPLGAGQAVVNGPAVVQGENAVPIGVQDHDGRLYILDRIGRGSLALADDGAQGQGLHGQGVIYEGLQYPRLVGDSLGVQI